MGECLYNSEHGFFATGPLRSTKGGDFLTSPEVSPWFGATLARYVSDRLHAVTGAARLVEVGAGSGSLLNSMLDQLGGGVPVHVTAVEASPAARSALSCLSGVTSVVATLAETGRGWRGVVVANELIDNLPVALAVRTGTGWQERWVGEEHGELTLVAAAARDDVAAWADAYAGAVGEGALVEVQLAAGQWIEDALDRLDAGALVVIDYGGTTEELEPRRTLGTLRTYRSHHLGPDPLTAPGETDVTVDVQFTALADAAERSGARVALHRQDDFLTEWGLRDELRSLRRRELALARDGDSMARLAIRSEIKDAETLLHPRGLGDFRVLTAEVDGSSA